MPERQEALQALPGGVSVLAPEGHDPDVYDLLIALCDNQVRTCKTLERLIDRVGGILEHDLDPMVRWVAEQGERTEAARERLKRLEGWESMLERAMKRTNPRASKTELEGLEAEVRIARRNVLRGINW